MDQWITTIGVARICAVLIWKTLTFIPQASSQGDSVDASFVFEFIVIFNDRLFPEKYTVKDHISDTKLEKGDHYCIQNTAQGSFFPLQSFSKKTLRNNFLKNARKYKRNVLLIHYKNDIYN